MKPARWRPLALRDVDEAAAWYGEHAGLALELAFADALESAVKMLMQHPGVGSSRHAVLLKLQDLRVWPLKGFPYFIFYIERDTDIVIWRAADAARHSCVDERRRLSGSTPVLPQLSGSAAVSASSL